MTERTLTQALAAALGVQHASRAVLILEAGQPPRLEVHMVLRDSLGRVICNPVTDDDGRVIARRIARMHFMLRLEPTGHGSF